MRQAAFFLIFTALAGCKSQADKAAESYAIMESGATYAERCDEAGRVARAYLDERREQQYREWKQTERGMCAFARIDPR